MFFSTGIARELAAFRDSMRCVISSLWMMRGYVAATVVSRTPCAMLSIRIFTS